MIVGILKEIKLMPAFFRATCTIRFWTRSALPHPERKRVR